MPSGGPKVPSSVPAHAPGQRVQTQLGAGTPASPRCPSSPNPNPNPNPVTPPEPRACPPC